MTAPQQAKSAMAKFGPILVGAIVFMAFRAGSAGRHSTPGLPHDVQPYQTVATTSTASQQKLPSASFPRGPLEIQPPEGIDETLFQLRLLERLYYEWPTDTTHADQMQGALGSLRHRANRFHEYFKETDTEPKITSLYSDFLALLDAYIGFLADINMIEREAVARQEKESTETGFQSGFAGGYVAAQAKDSGASGGDAFALGALVTAINYAWDDYNKGKARDDAKRREIRERLAWSLLASGRLDDAVKYASEVRDLRTNTFRYAYNSARLISWLGNNEIAFNWFRLAVLYGGYNAIALARKDPDFEKMRSERASAFAELAKIKYRQSIVWGVLNDDIVVTNDSAFPLTNVSAGVRIESQGRSWTPVLKAAQIGAGESYKWENVVSIPGSRYDKFNVSLTCDQNK